MFIELLDTLRCVQPHEDAWLVGSFDELVDRHVIRGTLGCPVCSAEYPVRGGVVDFRPDDERAGEPADASDAAAFAAAGGIDAYPSLAATDVYRVADKLGEAAMPDDSAAVRLAAMLGLAEPGGIVVLMGHWTSSAPALEALTPGAQFLLVNPATPVFPFASAVRTREVLPIASGAVRAVAYDSAGNESITATQAARVIRQGGRLVAPATESLPEGVSELARDATQWVGERQADAGGPVLRLTRRK